MKYSVTHAINREEALLMDRESLDTEEKWRRECLGSTDMTALETEMCLFDLENIAYARRRFKRMEDAAALAVEIANTVRHARVRCGISRQDAAAALGVSTSTLTRWEQADVKFRTLPEHVEAINAWAKRSIEDHVAAARELADSVERSETPAIMWEPGSDARSIRKNAVAAEATAILTERGFCFDATARGKGSQ